MPWDDLWDMLWDEVQAVLEGLAETVLGWAPGAPASRPGDEQAAPRPRQPASE